MLDLHQTELVRLERIARNAGLTNFYRQTLPLSELYLATGQIHDGDEDRRLHWAGVWGSAGVARRVDAQPGVSEQVLIEMMIQDAANFIMLADSGMLMEGGKVRLG